MRGRSFAARTSLTGISSTTIAPAPKLAWAWEGGEAFDSSPAIVDGVVYVGTATGELIAVGLADGKLRWRYKAGEAIGESSPAVANGRVFIGDLTASCTRSTSPTASRSWTFKTQSEIKSSPVVVGDVRADGLVRRQALRPRRRRPASSCWAYTTENYVHGTPCVVERRRALRRLRRDVSRRRRRRRARSAFATSATAYTGASVALVNNVAYFGTFDNQVLALDLGSRKVLWRYEHPDRKFPFYSSAAVDRRHRRARRPRSHGPRARRRRPARRAGPT